MDVNGQRFWMLTGLDQWRPRENPPAISQDAERRILRLASRRPAPNWPVSESAGRSRRDAVPQALDEFGTRAFFDAARQAILSTGALPGNIEILELADGDRLTSMTAGADGVLYLALNRVLRAIDLRNRWEPFDRKIVNFAVWKLAAASPSGVWVLGENGSIARLLGEERRQLPYGPYTGDTVRPCQENPKPPDLQLCAVPPWPSDAVETPVDIACHPETGVALLSWGTDGQARVRLLQRDLRYTAPWVLAGASFPYSLRWLSAGMVAVTIAGVAEAPVYDLSGTPGEVPPTGDFYPLRQHDGGPFMQAPGEPPHYMSATGPVPLRRLSLPSYARDGAAENRARIDSGSGDTVWHRLYLEASIPAHGAVRFEIAASDSTDVSDAEWFPHVFGEAGSQTTAPRGAWVPFASELPFHDGFLPCPRRPSRSGLFTVLLQRTGRRVRSLRGRYLHLRMRLSGDGLTSPEVAAVRVYGSRFSYLNRYLPELYRESLFGDDANAEGSATPPDFLERYLDNFEGFLTVLEERVGNAHLLTHPDTIPEGALEWLGSWLGFTFDPAYPLDARRTLLKMAPQMYRQRGTLPGLVRALDAATNGCVGRGDVVVVEDFRLRRVFATIIGADLQDENDPLTLGMAKSGNSFVGDSLFLGDEDRKEFLALFDAGLVLSPQEEKAVQALFDNLAHRLTILVHQDLTRELVGVIRRIVQLEAPAHLLTRVAPASERFLVGIASLVGVDTYLKPKPAPQPVRTGQSYIGVQDYILQPPSLDPRLESGLPPEAGGESNQPVADAGPARLVNAGNTFTLDASQSRAGPGRTLETFRWTRIS